MVYSPPQISLSFDRVLCPKEAAPEPSHREIWLKLSAFRKVVSYIWPLSNKTITRHLRSMWNWHLPVYFHLPVKEASHLFRHQFNSASALELSLPHLTAPSFSTQSAYEDAVPEVFPSRVLPAATCAPSCSFMHSSSWAREPDHKDALLLFWLQLTSPWFLSSSFWASCCLSPKSQNWSALSHSNWDWIRDICFIEGKPTHCAYVIFNAIYRCTHVSKYTGTHMFLLFALFAFSSPLIDRDRFFSL